MTAPDAAGNAQPEAEPEAHDCSGPECHPYPTFDDDPARWGLLPEPEMTEAELEAEAEAEWADEWDSEDSNAYQDRVEAGLEPEPEL